MQLGWNETLFFFSTQGLVLILCASCDLRVEAKQSVIQFQTIHRRLPKVRASSHPLVYLPLSFSFFCQSRSAFAWLCYTLFLSREREKVLTPVYYRDDYHTYMNIFWDGDGDSPCHYIRVCIHSLIAAEPVVSPTRRRADRQTISAPVEATQHSHHRRYHHHRHGCHPLVQALPNQTMTQRRRKASQ